MALKPLAITGSVCRSDPRGQKETEPGPEHWVAHPDEDAELLRVEAWLHSRARPLAELMTVAVDEAVHYVLDGARTGRFDLNDPEVDGDERRTVGTKLQYRVLYMLGLEKLKPLDAIVDGVPVDIKGTVGKNWTIPKEGQCQVCLLVQVDPRRDRHRAFLMRTHRVWLNDGFNGDRKRTTAKLAFDAYARTQYDWTPLRPNPLKQLTAKQRDVVFAPRVGQEKRLTALFGYLRNTVIPRWAILTVCANRDDPLRRVRAVKDLVWTEHALTLLCGKFTADKVAAKEVGFDLSDAAWVAHDRTPNQPPDKSEV